MKRGLALALMLPLVGLVLSRLQPDVHSRVLEFVLVAGIAAACMLVLQLDMVLPMQGFKHGLDAPLG